MAITTTDQARLAFAAVLRAEHPEQAADLRKALEAPEAAHAVVDAAYVMLTSEALATLRTKRWRPADILRAARKGGGLDRRAQRLVELAVVQPVELATALPDIERSQFNLVRCVLAALRFFGRLPALGGYGPPPEAARPSDARQAKMLDRVRALLAKAESTPFDAEADAFNAKAQELMARHAIDEALLGDAGDGGGGGSNECTSMRVTIESPYASPKARLLAAVARHNRCRAVWSDAWGFSTVFGTAADLRAVDMLYTSLLVQAVGAMQRADERTRSFRHAFLLAFAERIGQRLRAANAAAAATAVEESGDSFLPVLAARDDAAERARDAAFPRLTRMRTSMSNASGYLAGRVAADGAALGGPSVGRRDSPSAIIGS